MHVCVMPLLQVQGYASSGIRFAVLFHFILSFTNIGEIGVVWEVIMVSEIFKGM